MTFVQTLTAATYKNRLLLLQQSSLTGGDSMHSNRTGFCLAHCGWRSSYCISRSCRTTTVGWLGFVFSVLLCQAAARVSRACAAGQAEPEDHAAILCEIMAGLVSGRFPAPAGSDRELFEQHFAPWIGRFFADLEQAEAAAFYRRVGTLGRVFVEIETEAFALPS